MQPEQNYWDQQSSEAVTPALQPVQDTGTPQPAASTQPLSWQASEAVHHEKNAVWFVGLAAAAAVLLLVDIFLVHSWTFGALIVVMAIAAGMVAARPPRMLSYSLSPTGLMIDQKQFGLRDFRAFGVMQESAFYSIRLIPNKRFMPMVNVFFPPEMGEAIVDFFGAHLPMEELSPDPIDKLVEKLRF